MIDAIGVYVGSGSRSWRLEAGDSPDKVRRVEVKTIHFRRARGLVPPGKHAVFVPIAPFKINDNEP
jgi:hypothetical protein